MTDPDLVGAARRLLRSRQIRDEVFAEEATGFGEPAWDMLLELFILDGEGRTYTVDQLTAHVAVEIEVAYRSCEWLLEHDLAIGTADPRVIVIGAHGRVLMRNFLVRQAELEGSVAPC